MARKHQAARQQNIGIVAAHLVWRSIGVTSISWREKQHRRIMACVAYQQQRGEINGVSAAEISATCRMLLAPARVRSASLLARRCAPAA